MKQLDALESTYDIIVAGDSVPLSYKVEFININVSPTTPKYFSWPWIFRLPFAIIAHLKRLLFEWFPMQKYWQSSQRRIQFKILRLIQKPDLIICHHFMMLPLAYKLKKQFNSALILNTHEYYPLEYENQLDWLRNNFKMNQWIGKTYLSHCNSCFGVSEHINQRYLDEFGKDFVYIPNDKKYLNIEPSEVTDTIKLVHHGNAIPERGLEAIGDSICLLPASYTLTFILVEIDPEYLQAFQDRYHNEKRICFKKEVEVKDISASLNSYDIGLCIIEPSNFTYKYCLPNKFFEFIQARLAIIAGLNPEVVMLTEKHNLGLSIGSHDANSIAKTILRMSKSEIVKFKQNVHRKANELSDDLTFKAIQLEVNKALE